MRYRFQHLVDLSAALCSVALGCVAGAVPSANAELTASISVEKTLEADGRFRYEYLIEDSASSMFTIDTFVLDVGPRADLQSLEWPSGWIGRYDAMEDPFELVFLSGASQSDIRIGGSGVFAFTSPLDAAPLDYLIANLDPGLGEPSIFGEIDAPAIFCDFNADSACDVGDINLMFQQGDLVTGVAVGASNPFDLNVDMSIDNDDLDQFLADAATKNGYASPFLRGDTDDIGASLTRDVDITDFNSLATHFLPVGTSTPSLVSWDKGNFDGDDDIDITDFNFLAINFAPTGYVSPGAVVTPEPSGLALVGLGWLCLVGYRWAAAN